MNPNLLILALVLVPTLGAFLISVSQAAHARALAGFWSLLTFGFALAAAWKFDWHPTDPTQPLVQLLLPIPWVPAFGLNFGFGVDAISLWLVLLTCFLQVVVILGNVGKVTTRVREFYFWLLILQASMLGAFIATDVIFFYTCFEFTLVPLFFLIGIFGGAQRLAAARVFFLYTFTGSMLTFAGLLYVAWFNTKLPTNLFVGAGEWSFNIRTLYGAARQMSNTQQTWLLVALLAGFAVKLPLFPFHTWQPLTYSEAPTAGSVLLAGVLAKLGSYGMLRLAIPMAPEAVKALAPTIAALAVAGILYTALICWVQKDIKKLIAYSSISHLGFVALGLFALNPVGAGGAVFYMVSHGLSTGALFLCVGMLIDRFQTREMSQMSGLAKVMPIWAFFMVFFALASVGLPGLNGFVGEFLTLLGAFSAEHVLGSTYAGVAGIGIILAAIYVLYMLGKVVWGPLKVPRLAGDATGANANPDASGKSPAVADLNFREIATLAPLALACLVLGLAPTPMLRSIEPAVNDLIAPAQVGVATDAGPLAPHAPAALRAAGNPVAAAAGVAIARAVGSETAQ